jgi:hypothetical protein
LLSEEFLYRQNEFLIVGTLFGLLLSATEIGFRRGRAVRSKIEDSARSYYWTLQAGVMGLLALLLAFAFSMAVSRYEIRKQLLIDETNAIGTVYSIAGMLPEPYKSEAAKLVGNYVACRLHDYSALLDEMEVAAANRNCLELKSQLWIQALAVAAKSPAALPTGMFVSSLDNVANVSVKRDAARENHVPQVVLAFLFMVTILTLGLLGYGCGLGNHRHIAATATVCLLISLVILVIMDLDRPRRGLITISQWPMLYLQSGLK